MKFIIVGRIKLNYSEKVGLKYDKSSEISLYENDAT